MPGPDARPSVGDVIESVVVGVDGRQGGLDALALARDLAPRAELTLVTAYGFGGSSAPHGLVRRDDERRALELLCSVSAEHAPDADLRALPRTTPGLALQNVAAEAGADLIVVGAAHRGRVGRVLLGDDTRGTLSHTTRPVAVAPAGYAAPHHDIAEVVVGYDGGAPSRAALAAATALAGDLAAPLRLLCVAEVPAMVPLEQPYDWEEIIASRRRHAEAILREAPVAADVGRDVAIGDAADELARSADPGAVLLVVGSHAPGPIGRIFLGSVADRVTHRAPCPVLVVPAPRNAGPEADGDAGAVGTHPGG